MGALENAAIIGGLVGVQFIYAGNAEIVSYAMSLGLSPLTIVIFTSLATFIILFPVAFCFERSQWPKNCTLKFVTQIWFISFAGLLFQSLFLKGISLTSPAMGTAMPNLAPALIFIIAWSFGLEKVDLSNTYSKLKILGTMLCVFGALTMSVMQSISAPAAVAQSEDTTTQSPTDFLFDMQKIIGCLFLMGSVLTLSGNVVLQAFALRDFAAPMSLSAVTSLVGGLMTAFVQVAGDQELKTGLQLVSFGDLIGYSVLGGAVSGMSLSFNGWAIKKRGPVFVSMFSPIGTCCSVIISVFTLGEIINIGSLAGMLLMFIGLYLVLWAKGKEDLADAEEVEEIVVHEADKPLLC